MWETFKQLFTGAFWTRIVTRPHEAVFADPLLAAKSAAAGAVAALAVAGAVVAAPVVGSGFAAMFGVGKAALPALGFAAKHPILTYAALANIEAPTEIIRAFGAVAARPVPVSRPAAPVPRST